jgi:hypothetical protein
VQLRRFLGWRFIGTNEKHDLNIAMELEVEELFTYTYSFKRPLKTYVVQNDFDYFYKHNDKGRVSAICREKHCSWRIHASIDAKRTSMQIKIFYPMHVCGNHYENTRYDVEYLICTYKSSFNKGWREIITLLSHCSFYSAKNEVLLHLFSSHDKQYRQTRRYTSALLLSNHGSSCYIQRNGAFFQRMYIYLYACKKGFNYGCGPIISLDAWHLKGAYGGQLLCVIGKDGNNNMFSIAFAVAEAET